MDNITGKEKAYFRIAKNVSTLSDHRCKIGCVIVDGHRVISSGYNSNSKVHRLQAEIDTEYFGCTCYGKVHAETSALIPLINSKYDLRNATVYTYREDRNGQIAISRPCPRCMSLIKKCGIKKIKYTTNDGFAKEYINR